MYKGHKQYINSLGRFCAVFEIAIRNRITGDKQFALAYPQSYAVFKTFKQSLGHAKASEIDNVLSTRRNVTLAYCGNNSLVYELCRHVRNSVCHMLLKVEDDNLYIYDKSFGKTTCKGYIQKKKVLSFINSIVREYEQSED